MNKAECKLFDKGCAAPLCPMDDTAHNSGIWYADEEICKVKAFQTLDWIKKQKAIIRVKASEDKYFTVEMLEAIKQVRKGLEGISPDQPLEQAKQAERKWIIEKEGGRVIANQNSESPQVTRAKRSDLVAVGESSHRAKGGQK